MLRTKDKMQSDRGASVNGVRSQSRASWTEGVTKHESKFNLKIPHKYSSYHEYSVAKYSFWQAS